MDGVHLDPFQGGIVSSGLMSIPPIITGIPSTSPSGPIVTAHIGVGSIPTSGGPIPATVVTTIPPFIPGGSGTSMSVLTIPSIPMTFPTIGIQPHPPPFMHGNYIPIAIDTLAGPSGANLDSSIPFMATLNLSNLARWERTPKITSCHSTYGVHLTALWMTLFN